MACVSGFVLEKNTVKDSNIQTSCLSQSGPCHSWATCLWTQALLYCRGLNFLLCKKRKREDYCSKNHIVDHFYSNHLGNSLKIQIPWPHNRLIQLISRDWGWSSGSALKKEKEKMSQLVLNLAKFGNPRSLQNLLAFLLCNLWPHSYHSLLGGCVMCQIVKEEGWLALWNLSCFTVEIVATSYPSWSRVAYCRKKCYGEGFGSGLLVAPESTYMLSNLQTNPVRLALLYTHFTDEETKGQWITW